MRGIFLNSFGRRRAERRDHAMRRVGPERLLAQALLFFRRVQDSGGIAKNAGQPKAPVDHLLNVLEPELLEIGVEHAVRIHEPRRRAAAQATPRAQHRVLPDAVQDDGIVLRAMRVHPAGQPRVVGEDAARRTHCDHRHTELFEIGLVRRVQRQHRHAVALTRLFRGKRAHRFDRPAQPRIERADYM